MNLSKLIDSIDTNRINKNTKLFKKEVSRSVKYFLKLYRRNRVAGILSAMALACILLGSFVLGFNVSELYTKSFIYRPNLTSQVLVGKQNENKYIPSNGVGQEAPIQAPIKNDGKKITRDFIDFFKNIYRSLDPLFKDFLNFTPQYITQAGTDIQFTTGTVKSSKPVFDIFMGISTSIIVLFLTIESIKVISGSSGSLKELGKKYIIGFILLFISGWILSVSIDLANVFTQDVIGINSSNGQSILTEFVNKYLDNLKAKYQDSNTEIFGVNTGSNNSNPLEILQVIFQAFVILLPTIVITILFLFIILQMAWRWVILYLLAPFVPLAQVFYLAPFKNDITRNFWNSWISNLIHLPIFLICYKIFYEGFLANQTTTSNSQILIFIVFIFILWQVNSQIGRIFGEIGVISSNTFGNGLIQGLGYESGRMGIDYTKGGVKNTLKGGIGLIKSTRRGAIAAGGLVSKAANAAYGVAKGRTKLVLVKKNREINNQKESKLLSKALKKTKSQPYEN
ncbi:MAG: hypothetical protein H7196_00320 [candidate division SR1 bacterium]|nr:hypothetical protein [candidate division SR1 bacterium]